MMADVRKVPVVQLTDEPYGPIHLQPPQHTVPHRNGHVHLGAYSPVHENGSFAFDQILKCGKVNRRLKHKHAFRASWKPGYLVLRPNLLSIYEDEETTRLRLSITLSDVTAVALVRSPRSDRQHVFGVFTPSKNYRFQTLTERDADDWIERIRSETRIDEDDEAFLAFAGITRQKQATDYSSEQSNVDQIKGPRRKLEQGASSSLPKHLPCASAYSSYDIASFSEWSDGLTSRMKIGSIPSFHEASSTPGHLPHSLYKNLDSNLPWDAEKVICNGYLQGLRIEGGVRQWRRRWGVLRPKSLTFYKNEDEYSAIKVIPMAQVIDAAEIDPLSRTKKFCFQIIDEGETYRLCAPDEESLSRWLGCLKSIIVVTRHSAKAARSPSVAW